MASRINGHEFEQAPEMVKDKKVWHAAVHGVAKSWKRLRLNTTTTNYLFGFLGGSDDKESACNAGDVGPVLASGRFPGEVNGYPL